MAESRSTKTRPSANGAGAKRQRGGRSGVPVYRPAVAREICDRLPREKASAPSAMSRGCQPRRPCDAGWLTTAPAFVWSTRAHEKLDISAWQIK